VAADQDAELLDSEPGDGQPGRGLSIVLPRFERMVLATVKPSSKRSCRVLCNDCVLQVVVIRR
jgi:hypothetical protein